VGSKKIEAGIQGLIRNGYIRRSPDLRHTVGKETRAEVLWHVRRGMPKRYAVAQAREIYEVLEKLTDERFASNNSLAAIAREAEAEVPAQMKNGQA